MQEYCSNQNIIPNFTRKNDYFVNKRESSKYETKQKKNYFFSLNLVYRPKISNLSLYIFYFRFEHL